MAESAVKSSVNLLGKLLVDEGKYLWGVEQKVEGLRDELLWMRSFLRKADTIQHKDEIVWMWVAQVQKYVSEAEDIIEKFIIKVVSHRQQSGLLNKLRRYSCIFRELYYLYEAGSSIDSLTVKISTLSPKLEKYGLLRSFKKKTDHIEEAITDQIQQSLQNAYMEDKNIVGLEENAKEIINILKSSPPRKGFHAIYGMGGSGKTTLATKVFKDDVIRQHFSDGQAFVYVSKQFKFESVLQEILKGLNSSSYEDKGLNSRSSEDEGLNSCPYKDNDPTIVKLQKFLQKKKCLVVVDDVWTEQAWDSLKSAFFTCEGDSGSKVLLTTRKKDVARHVDMKALQKPDLLKHPKDWELLKETMKWHPQDISTQKQDTTEIIGRNDDCAKSDLAKKMLKVCEGVPLAIVVLGGILRKKKTLAEWESVSSSHLIAGYDHGRSYMEILLYSYDDLPYHLKPCFLHLSNFPEGYLIGTKNLYWMWIAEGLVSRSTCDRTAGTKSLEEVANDYLTDLARVGLVKVVERSSKRWIQSIRMHDLVRDVCLEKATADNFLQAIDLRSGLDQQPSISDYYNEKRLLRMAVFLPDDTTGSSIVVPSFKYLRSLIFIYPNGYTWGYPDISECQKLMTHICSEFQLLRVLVFGGLKLHGRLTSQVENLVHLRYLSLRYTGVSELPSSIGNLRFLEILDLRDLNKLIIPNTLWKLHQLRHLLFPNGNGYEIKRSEKLRVDTLICLETIENLLVRNLGTKGMANIKKLRKLSISDEVSKKAILDIIHALKSNRLQSCFIRVEGNALTEVAEILSANVCGNCCLVIVKPIQGQKLENVAFPQYLEKLVLDGCKLKDDPMSILGSLYHLKTLKLTEEAYVGRIMRCSATSFPLLEGLEIRKATNLEVLELENGSMPKLRSLCIVSCEKLNRIPDVLPLLLQDLSLFHNGTTQDHPVDLNSGGVQTVCPFNSGKYLKDAVLKGKHEKVVLMGKDGPSKGAHAFSLSQNKDVSRHFHAVAWTWVPSRRSCGLLPRGNLEQLLRDLRDPTQSRDGQALSRMGYDDLRAELQRTMQQRKCLVILLNLEVDFDHLDADLEKTFGRRECYAGKGSKLVITSQSDKEPSAAAIECHLFHVRPPTQFETWNGLQEYFFIDYLEGLLIKWNLMRHCFGRIISYPMLVEVLKTKENIKERAEKLTNSSPMEFSQIFALCYDDLQPHLRRCLIHLANFPEEAEISTKKLYQMWIAAGFVCPKQDDVHSQESLKSLARSCLSELNKRFMLQRRKSRLDGSVKKCQLWFALRDVCLKKGKEDNMLAILDQFENTTSSSTSKIKTQQLAVHLGQNSVAAASLEEKLCSLEFIVSPTSLLFFHDFNHPVYNEEKWEWFLYICKHFHTLRILDLGGMWMTKGRLPMEVGNLAQLRYLSLRGTWVSELPQSIEDLSNLQTLDLRVLESIIIPDVLWKLDCLTHLYLPDFIAQETVKLQLRGLTCLETLVNLLTDKVCLNDLLQLGQLRKISIRKIHAVEVVDELDGILKQLSTSLQVCFNSEIINVDQTILSRFKNLHKLKIKGIVLAELNPEMFPANLEEVTLKHTKLEKDPLPVLEKLPQLRSLILEHESYLGKEMTFSKDFYERTKLVLCLLNNLETLYSPESNLLWPPKIDIQDCWRVEKNELPTSNNSSIRDGEEDVKEEDVQTRPRSFDMSSLKKGFKSLTCW